MNGKLIKITASDGTIYASRTDEIQTECEIQEIASATSGNWKTFLAGRKSWSVSTSFLVGLGKINADLLKIGSTVTLSITDGTSALSGDAIVESAKITATKGNTAQGSFSFQGTGPLV